MLAVFSSYKDQHNNAGIIHNVPRNEGRLETISFLRTLIEHRNGIKTQVEP